MGGLLVLEIVSFVYLYNGHLEVSFAFPSYPYEGDTRDILDMHKLLFG